MQLDGCFKVMHFASACSDLSRSVNNSSRPLSNLHMEVKEIDVFSSTRFEDPLASSELSNAVLGSTQHRTFVQPAASDQALQGTPVVMQECVVDCVGLRLAACDAFPSLCKVHIAQRTVFAQVNV